MNPWILLAVLALIALTAPRYGVDSRRLPAGELRPPRRGPTPFGDLAAVARSVHHRFAPSTEEHPLGVVGAPRG